MLKTIARIDWAAVGESAFTTLTYPDANWETPYHQRTMQRSLFMRWVEREAGRPVSSLWRIEWKERRSGARKGELAPHMHYLMFGVPFLNAKALNEQWTSIIGSEQYVQTNVQACEAGKMAALYACKYAAKCSVSILDNDAYLSSMAGRHWGITRKELVPWCPERVSDKLGADQVALAQDIKAEKTGERCEGSFTVFDDDAERLYLKIVGDWKKE